MTATGGGAPRFFAVRLLVVTLLALALRIAWLPGLPPLHDDVDCAASAINFVERGQIGPTMWQHPRLRDLVVYASVSALGTQKLGLVFPSLLLGVLSIAVTGLLARRLAGERAGLLAALLLAVDSLHVGYSRQAVQEVYTALFGAAGVLLVLHHLDSGRTRSLLVAGFVFGLGLAAKWSVAFPLVTLLGFAAWIEWRRRGRTSPELRARLALLAATLVLLPAAVYLATWAPWFAAGRGLPDFVRLHGAMAAEASTHAGFNAADLAMPHRALLWFLWPVHYADTAFGPDGPVPLIAISNPLTWLATVPAVAVLARRARREGAPEAALLCALVLVTWIPFALASRPIWMHSALAVVPFALTAVAAAASRLADATLHGARALAAYAVAAAIVATPLYLLVAGVALEVPGLRGVALSYRPEAALERAPGR